jgi:hypothetical protein
MLVYVYKAALYCEACGEGIRYELTAKGKAPTDPDNESSYDSDDFPKGPCDEGESDSPGHCDDCGMFLETTLTADGIAYVQQAIAEDRAGSVALTTWKPFYSHLWS